MKVFLCKSIWTGGWDVDYKKTSFQCHKYGDIYDVCCQREANKKLPDLSVEPQNWKSWWNIVFRWSSVFNRVWSFFKSADLLWFSYCLILSLCSGDGPCFSYISLSGIIRSLRQTDSFDFKNYLLNRHYHHHMFNSWLNSKVVRLTVRGESHLLKLNKPAC